MKNKYLYIISLILVLFLGACGKDFLDIVPEDSLTADNYYRNETEVRAGTASLYGYPWFEFEDKFNWLVGECLSGNLYYTYGQEGQYLKFSFNEGNSYLSEGWRGLYRVVSYANSIINDMPGIASENGVSQTIIDQAIAEARFVRAAAYFVLAEYWGEVPIVENSTELVLNNNLMLPRNTRTSIYEFIKRDLEYAAENLKETDDAGRVTKWAAKGYLARLYLTMASDLSNSNSADYFNSAKEYALDVIQNSGYSLMDKYHDLFLIENNNNSESLFALQWIKGGYALGSSRNANWARSTFIADQQWGDGKGVTIDFRENVEYGDARRHSIFMSYGEFYPELNKANGGYTYNIQTPSPTDPTSNIENANEVLNHLKKYVVGSSADNDGQVGTDQDAAINHYMLRLADVYLMYTEAVMGSDTTTPDVIAVGYFNEIRKRANLSEKSEVTYMQLLKERRIEFALECRFWMDLKRFYYRDAQKALDYINAQRREYKYVLMDEGDSKLESGYEIEAPETIVQIHGSQMFLPIPTAEVVANPLLAEPAVEYQFN